MASITGRSSRGYDELHAIHERLKKRGGSWWLAAGQNTPIRLAEAPAATAPRA